MEVSNHFHEESLSYIKTGKNLSNREQEILELQKIQHCCAANKERLESNISALYEQKVSEEQSFFDWAFDKTGDQDIKRLMSEIVQTMTDYQEKDCEINISLGSFDGCVCDEQNYWCKRRFFLKSLHKPSEFAHFMRTCFVKCEFSDDLDKGLKTVKDFKLHTSEIVDNLALLNDEALQIYRECGDEKEAMRRLKAKALDCSGDPSHRKYLQFPFSYVIEENGKKCNYQLNITCEPHMKLIRKDSNLRIYFTWCNENVGSGDKVLIGRIGSHPY